MPDIPPGNLLTLMEALHALHARAGWPSTRQMAQGQEFSHTAVHDLFTKTDTAAPRLPVLLAVVAYLVRLDPRRLDVDAEIDRFDAMWQQALAKPTNTPTNALPGLGSKPESLRQKLKPEPEPEPLPAPYAFKLVVDPRNVTEDNPLPKDLVGLGFEVDLPAFVSSPTRATYILHPRNPVRTLVHTRQVLRDIAIRLKGVFQDDILYVGVAYPAPTAYDLKLDDTRWREYRFLGVHDPEVAARRDHFIRSAQRLGFRVEIDGGCIWIASATSADLTDEEATALKALLAQWEPDIAIDELPF